jgi:molybdopterin-guanine dinucleotide biosynthesis protein B
MKVFSFFGSSSSGKTTIISHIIGQLSGEMKIVYIKDIPHDNISLDTENKDTWKMENAGAYETYGLSPGRTYKMARKRTSIREIIDFEKEADIFLIEGFKEYMESVRFLVLGSEKFPGMEHDYIIGATNRSCKGKCILYPEEFEKILEILRTP